MTPNFQGLVALTICVVLGLLLLSKVLFVVARNLSHMANGLFVVLGRILPWMLLQNLNDLTTTTVTWSIAIICGGYYQDSLPLMTNRLP